MSQFLDVVPKLTDDLVVGDMFPIGNNLYKITSVREWAREIDFNLELVGTQYPAKPDTWAAKVTLSKNHALDTYV